MNNDKPGNPGKTIYYVQQIVDFMNERPDKLFGGIYPSFRCSGRGVIPNGYKDGIQFVGIDYDFNYLPLLRALAKAKWGDDTTYLELEIEEGCVDDDFYNVYWTGLKREYYLYRWCLIEDESERIACIAKDILS